MVVTPGGTSSTSGTGNDYRYFDIPSVTSISPTSGPLTGGTVITINGLNLDGATKVTIGTTEVTTFASLTDTTLVFASPARAAGEAHITVTTPGGTSTATSADLFTYVSRATVTSLSRTTAPLSGATLTITGTNFTGATAVNFGLAAATTFSAFCLLWSLWSTEGVGLWIWTLGSVGSIDLRGIVIAVVAFSTVLVLGGYDWHGQIGRAHV